MLKGKKRILYFLEEINEFFVEFDQEEKKNILIKFVLLKWLIDHQRIQWDILIQQSLSQEFTFENILCCWNKDRTHFLRGKKYRLPQSIFNRLYGCILGSNIFSQEPPTILGEVYEYLNNLQQKKKGGMFYTPSFVIDFMLENEFYHWEIQNKILDPACGCGFFLSVAYDRLMKYYLSHPQFFGTDEKAIHKHILEKQIYGIEKDPLAATIAKLILILKQSQYIETNLHIYCGDALLETMNGLEKIRFRLVVGNPPYIGHKKMDKKYSIQLKEKYGLVYQDKGDMSYCFFQRGIEYLEEGGRLCFIISRYFLEALYGTNLREYLMNHSTINKIIDFYGQRILKGIGIDPLIITLTKKKMEENHNLKVYKLSGTNKKVSGEMILKNIKEKRQSPYIHFFSLPQSELKKEGWRLLCPMDRRIVRKIESKCNFQLGDICESKQGIITGRDKAFVISKEKAKENGLSHLLLKPWIKGKDIHSFFIGESNTLLLYSNDIESIEGWKEEKNYLWPFKSQLEKRRECVRGVRKWYELQWGREKEFFQSPKIIFPYKASHNQFALDDQGRFYSADVYGIRLKEVFKGEMSLRILTLLFNSSLYEFYFKTFAKKLGRNLYEYYPNTLRQLQIPQLGKKEQTDLEKYYRQIIYSLKEENQKVVLNIQKKVDQWFMKYFEFNQQEGNYLTSLFDKDLISRDS